jgi:hypothetical protein
MYLNEHNERDILAMIRIRVVENLIDKIEYSNNQDNQTYPSSDYTCDKCGEILTFSLKHLDKHRFLKFSNLDKKDKKIMDKLILSMIPKSKIKLKRQIWTLNKSDRFIVTLQRIYLRLTNCKTPFLSIPKLNENIPDSFIDFNCLKCKRPVRIYYSSYLGGKHGEIEYKLKYILD